MSNPPHVPVVFLALSLVSAAGCRENDTPTEATDVDSDTDPVEEPCDAYTRDRMADQVASSLCRWAMTCPPDQRPESFESCADELASFWRAAPAFDACLARECAVWVRDAETCESYSDIPAACNDFPNP